MIMFQTQDTVFVKFSWKGCSYESFISKAEVPFDNWSVSQFDDDHREMFVEREKRRNEILTKISSLRYTLIALLSWSLRWFLNTRIEMRHTSIPFLTTCMDRSCSWPPRFAGKLYKTSHQDFQRRYYCRYAPDLCFSLSELNPKTVRVVSSWKERGRMSGSSKSDPVSPMIEWSCVPGCTPYYRDP